MSSTMNLANDAPTTTTDDAFEAAADEARAVLRGERAETEADLLVPSCNVEADDEPLVEALTRMFSNASLRFGIAANEPDADEVDGAKPERPDYRTARTFLVESDDESDEPTFSVAGTYENSYGDERVAVETPAPWDMPDDHGGDDPNEVVKSLPWADDEAAEADDYDPDEGAFYTFDDDDRAAPSFAANAWVVDKVAVAELMERAKANGYAWDGRADDGDDERENDALDYAAGFADSGERFDDESGDRVTVRYLKANGNGVSENSGRVLATGDEGRLRFETDDGKTRYVTRDDDADPSLYHSGQYPYMGEVVAITVEPDN